MLDPDPEGLFSTTGPSTPELRTPKMPAARSLSAK